jgi:hypothetical protein
MMLEEIVAAGSQNLRLRLSRIDSMQVSGIEREVKNG